VVEVVLLRRDTREIQSLSEARILQAYPALRTSYERQQAASRLFDWVRHLVPEDTPAPTLYTLTERTLHLLALHGPSEALEIAFLLRAVRELGYPPRLDRCQRCGHPTPAYLSAAHGGALCSTCARTSDTPVVAVGTKGIQHLRKLQNLPLSEVFRHPSPDLLGPLLVFLEALMDLRLPRRRAPQSPPGGETP